MTGFLLEPVFKKDFKKEGNSYNRKYIKINLGRIPSWVNQDYEVNLTIINKNRTCKNIIFYQFRSKMNLDLNLALDLDTISPYSVEVKEDSLIKIVYYKKGESAILESNLIEVRNKFENNNAKIKQIIIEGFSSLEGATEINENLYNKRANNILTSFEISLIDSSKIIVVAEENFKDFRIDIKGTKFEYLASFSDLEIKEKLKDTLLVKNARTIIQKS